MSALLERTAHAPNQGGRRAVLSVWLTSITERIPDADSWLESRSVGDSDEGSGHKLCI